MKLLNFCYLLYLTFVYLTFVTSFTNTLLTFLFVLVLPFCTQLFLLSCALVLSALAFQMNADLQGHISTDAFLDIALWILLQFSVVISFYLSFALFIYSFITLLVHLSPFLSTLVQIFTYNLHTLCFELSALVHPCTVHFPSYLIFVV